MYWKSYCNTIFSMACILLIVNFFVPPPFAFMATASIENGSAIINGSIDGIPTGTEVALFILNLNNGEFTVVPGLSSSNNIFSTPVNVNDNETLGFSINGKDTGVTATYHVGEPVNVHLQYIPPGGDDIIITVPAPEPTASEPTPTVTATPMPISVTPAPTPPAISIAAPTPTVIVTPVPSPSPEPPIAYPLIGAMMSGMAALEGLIMLLKRL